MTGKKGARSSAVGSSAAPVGSHSFLMLGVAAAVGAVGAVAMFAALVWAAGPDGGSDEPVASETPAPVETTVVARTSETQVGECQSESVNAKLVAAPSPNENAPEYVPSTSPDFALESGCDADSWLAKKPAAEPTSTVERCVEAAAESPELVLASSQNETSELATVAETSRQLPSRTSEDLARQLRESVPLIEFDTENKSMQKLILAAAKGKAKRQQEQKAKAAEEGAIAEAETKPTPDEVADDEPTLLRRLVSRRSDTDGLDFRWGDECHAEVSHAKVLEEISKAIRDIPAEARDRDEQIAHLIGMNSEWWIPEAVPAFEQILQVESADVRLKMLRILRVMFSPASTQAIARRALYDLEPEIRLEAIDALRYRPQVDYLPLLVDGLRYPWEAVAWNAAEALAQLGDAGMAESLLQQLDEPPPTAPFQDEQGNWRVRELAALKHTQNCILCHAPSSQQEDRVRGLIPGTGTPRGIPSKYYQSQGPVGDFVRADITYLQQDFSVAQPVKRAKSAQANTQRIDYVVRARKVTLEQRIDAAERARRTDNPHRQALLYTLRALTGLDEAALAARRQSG